MRLRPGPSERRSLSEAVLVQAVIETSSDAFVGVGTDGVVEDWSSGAEHLFGLRNDEVIGYPLDKLVHRGLVSPAGSGGLADVLLHPPRGEDRIVVEARALRQDGSSVPVEISLMRGAGPSGWSVRAFVRDVSDRVQIEQALARRTDQLTGLPGAQRLPAMISEAITEARAGKAGNDLVAVCHLAVDRTQVVNDALGHAAGDELLAALARRFVTATHCPGRVVRYGGDEFVAVVGGIGDLGDATRLASRIVKVMANPVLLARREVFPSASLGIALLDPEAVEHPAVARVVAR
ncbi:MAG TPA: sensor domain-containing diguanylate cyclase, partial [Acidimicrobiales bacterium]|nr:sensor domain-containing diguanylate cyclase [Acidimicrobiales bacterium]